MQPRLFNTLTLQIEPVYASDSSHVRLYACGPTVYDYGHIGNFRTFLHVDVLRRFLELSGLKVNHVMNITDVDDKIIRNAAKAAQPIAEYTHVYEQAFFEDLEALSILRPTHVPHATAHIPDMVALIERLAEKDIAYQAEDGSWYFRIARFPGYGKLSKKDLAGMEDSARVDLDEYDKDAARDFALWKAVKPLSPANLSTDGTVPDASAPSESGPHGLEQHWHTALGPGRPGWHIECSAMAGRLLGESIDLHAGGEDLMFPHHENEIAQSEAATGHPFVRHWMHVRFLLVEGKKMSKSEGNFYTLRDLLLKGYRASAIRFLLISVPYRHQLNFTFDGLNESTHAVERLRTFQQRMRDSVFPDGEADEPLRQLTGKAHHDYVAALANDLNTAEARAAVFDLVRAANTAADAGTMRAANVPAILAVLADFDAVFVILVDHDAELTRAALAWAEREGRLGEATPELREALALTDEAIELLVSERTLAKKRRNFEQADAIRMDLLNKGILLEDSKDGVRWKRK